MVSETCLSVAEASTQLTLPQVGGLETIDSGGHFGQDPRVKHRVRAGDDRHLVVRARPEERPRTPYVQNIRSSRSFLESLTGGPSRTPRPRSARNTWPDGISTMHPTVTSPIRTPWRSGAAATDTQHDSRPAIAGRVPSMGSTTSTVVAPPPVGATSPRSSE